MELRIEECVFELHGREDEDVHGEGDQDDADVESDEFVVFGGALIHKTLLNFANKIVVKENVDYEILGFVRNRYSVFISRTAYNSFLDAVPIVVYLNESVIDLQNCGCPY